MGALGGAVYRHPPIPLLSGVSPHPALKAGEPGIRAGDGRGHGAAVSVFIVPGPRPGMESHLACLVRAGRGLGRGLKGTTQSQACSPLFCLVSWGKLACDFPNFVRSFLADIYSLLIQQMCQALFNALLSIISL